MASMHWPFDERYAWPSDFFRALAPLFQGTGFQPTASRASRVFPPVNIYETRDGFAVRAEMPGVDKDALDISARGDQLTIQGERKVEATEGASFHRRERAGGHFSRVVTLPKPVDAERIQATFKNGVLEVLMPVVPQMQPRKIAVS